MKIKSRTPEQVAKILGVDVQTARRMFRNNEIPGGKIGGRWKVSDQNLIDYLQQRNIIPVGGEVDLDEFLEE